MGRSFQESMQPYRDARDVDVQQFADAAKVHFEAAYERTFGFGRRLAARREELGLTQEQVAERSGVRQSDISRIERGKTSPNYTTLQKLAEALHARIVLEPLL